MSLLIKTWIGIIVAIFIIVAVSVYCYYSIEFKGQKLGFSDETLILEEIDGFFPLEMIESFNIK